MSYATFFDKGWVDLIPIRAGDKRPTGKWTEYRATRESIAAHEGNLGLRTANFPTVDIDVTDPSLARELALLAGRTIGPAPVRFGRAPKCAIVYRTTEPFPKRWVLLEKDGTRHRVEILGDGQYVVVAGRHPDTGQPYRWTADPLPASRLPVLTAGAADRFLEAAVALAESRGYTVARRGTQGAAEGTVDQDDLVGDLEAVAAAIRAIPNDYSAREDYLTIGFALKAALRDHPEEAEALWHEWCTRWTGGENDPAVVARDWGSMAGPYRLGAEYLIRLARDRAGVDVAPDFAPLVDEPPPAKTGEALEGFTVAWLADRFAARRRAAYRYCGKLGGWLVWDNVRWAVDEKKAVLTEIAAFARQAAREAWEKLDPKDAKPISRVFSGLTVVRDTAAYASFSPAFATAVEDFDADPWSLNTPGGIVDLRTGTMLPPDPARLFTRATSVAPRAMPTPKWNAFLAEATGGDVALQAYLQRLVGYALTGSTREHTLAFLWGPGGNGKGVFLNTIVRAMGSYAAVSAMDTFTASRNDRHPTELAALAGARLVTAQETQEGRSWDEAKIKSITGGDPITARFMGRDFFTYQPQFTLLFAGNHRPRIANLDDAMRRRFHLVPFTVTPAKINPDLADQLLDELPGILMWAVQGCLAWQAEGLNPPLAVRDATEQYFQDEDPLGRWMAECVAPSTTITTSKDLYDAWCRWCTENGESPGTLRAFSTSLRTRGLEISRTSAARGYRVALKKTNPPTSAMLAGGTISASIADGDFLPLN